MLKFTQNDNWFCKPCILPDLLPQPSNLFYMDIFPRSVTFLQLCICHYLVAFLHGVQPPPCLKQIAYFMCVKRFFSLPPTSFCWSLLVGLMAFILVPTQFIAHPSHLFLPLFLSHFLEELLYFLPFMTWWVLQHPEFMGQNREYLCNQ